MRNNSPGPQLTATIPKAFIYGLLDPLTGQLKYVGKGKNPGSRLKDHIHGAEKTKTITHKLCWIRSLLEKGFTPEVIVLEEVEHQFWQEQERWWIMYMKSLGAKLTNGTSGGDGLCDPSPEVIAKFKAQVMSAEARAKISAHNLLHPRGFKKGHKHSEEALRKISETSKGRKLSAETIAKIVAKTTGRTRPPEVGRKISASKMGHITTPEAKAKMSAAKIGKSLSEEHKEKLKGRKLSEEHKAAMRAAWPKGSHHTEEMKAHLKTIPRTEKQLACMNWTGRKHSEESKAKMRDSLMKRRALEAQING